MIHESSNRFPESPWTLIGSLKRDDPADFHGVVEKICLLYARPLYAYAARQYPASDPGDLTQLTFQSILTTGCLAKADRERGKFRTFVIQILKSVASKQWKREERDRQSLRIDAEDCRRFSETLAVPEIEHPDTRFDWFVALDALARTFQRMQSDYARSGKREAFGILRDLGFGTGVPDAAQRLGVSEQALRVKLSRFRKEFAAKFRAEVAGRVLDPAEVEGEARYLLRLLKQRGSL